MEALERKLAALEGAEDCAATASGMAAISGAVLSLCEAGSHIVAPRAMYAESARLLRERLPRFGITTTFVDAPDPGSYARALTPATRLLYIETPNTRARGDRHRRPRRLARGTRLATLADNTFATPFAQNPSHSASTRRPLDDQGARRPRRRHRRLRVRRARGVVERAATSW